MKIIFMGTPQFSCPALQKLIDDKNFEITAVYTKEPQIANRGHKLTNSPIHELALKYNIPVITPKSLKNKEVQEQFKAFNADAAVVVAYGLILPQEILSATKFGCINIHPSLLPRWRGPSPIQYSLFAGDDKTGVCIIKMDEGIDSGDILNQEALTLNHTENYALLAEKLANLGSDLLVKTLKQINEGQITAKIQDANLITYTKKIEKSDCLLDFNQSAFAVNCKIRGLSGAQTAYFKYNQENIKIFEARIINQNSSKKPGEIVDDQFTIQCSSGQIQPLIIQRPGKNKMAITDFLRGIK